MWPDQKVTFTLLCVSVKSGLWDLLLEAVCLCVVVIVYAFQKIISLISTI